MTIERYDEWLSERRAVQPPADLTDQVMRRVHAMDLQQRGGLWLRLVDRIERSRAARWSLCGGALAVGSLPFFFLAHLVGLLGW